MTDFRTWIKEHLLALNLTDTWGESNEFNRLGFSREEKEAQDQFSKIATRLGLKTSQDETGNRWAVWEVDPAEPTIGMGSHLDTVYNGGGYDGVVGILSALAVIYQLKSSGFKPQKNIAVICFISEESSRFGVSTIGSRAIAGIIDKEHIQNIKDREGITVREAVEDFGLNWDQIDQSTCLNDQFESFLEIHIEQGSRLYNKELDIGIVRGIATPVRLKLTVFGKSNHTGTTLMNERVDALVAIAPLINYVSKSAQEISEASNIPMVATVSMIDIFPNAMNVIPGKVELRIDIRSVDDALKRKFAKQIESYCAKLGDKNSVDIHIEVLVDDRSILLDETIQEKLSAICEQEQLSYQVMDSGAGHDVMNMAQRWPSGLLFIPSEKGISHHPDEYTSMNDIENGVRMLTTYIKQEAE